MLQNLSVALIKNIKHEALKVFTRNDLFLIIEFLENKIKDDFLSTFEKIFYFEM